VPISEETRQRVLQAIAEIGYVPDARAQSLRSGDTRTIGLLVPDYSNPHYWDYVSGARDAAEESGYHLLVAEGDLSGGQRESAASVLSRWSLDGLIVNGLFTTQIADTSPIKNLMKHTPIVDIGYGDGEGVDRIIADYYAATIDAVRYLHTLNHQRIALLYGVPREDVGYDRLCAYQDALESVGIAIDESLIMHCGATIADGYEATLELLRLSERPTAIIAIDDMFAIAAIRAAADVGLHVPRDLSIIGYDDIPTAAYVVPRITTVSKDARTMGQLAVKLLLKRFETPTTSYERITIQPRLVIRESTAQAPSP
jgi:LacI family transcriptional regulator